MITRCDLCGLETSQPLKQSFAAIEKYFCCIGCQNVFTMLSEANLMTSNGEPQQSELFQQSLALGLIGNTEEQDPSTKIIKIAENAPVKEVLFKISGMWCNACAWFIETVLQKQPGIISAQVFFTSDLIKIKYYPQLLPLDNIVKLLNRSGYQVQLFNNESEEDRERQDLLLRLGISAFLWLNIMTLNTALYVGYFENISDSIQKFLPVILMLLATPVIFYCAQPIMRIAINGLYNRTVRMESLLALGILAAYFYSIVQIFNNGGHIYFDTAAAIVTLVLAGKYIEHNAKVHVSKAIMLLYQIMPKKVRVLIDNRETFIAVDKLQVEDQFIVKAGERIPVDGIVIAGRSHVDESLLTGESNPISKEPGSKVISGAINQDSILEIRTTKVGADTTLTQIVKLVENSLSQRSSLMRTVDKISRIFVPIVIVLAIATFCYAWMISRESSGDALMQAITVLVIACPCALGMATPLALTAAVGSATRQGILIRDSRVLEKVAKLDMVVLDKTGTVTNGDFAFIDFKLIDESSTNFFSQYLPLLAALENSSEHPLGRAVVKFAKTKNINTQIKFEKVSVIKGKGITGLIDNREIFIGNRKLLNEYAKNIDQLDTQANLWESVGYTVIFFGIDNRLLGIMAFGDLIKPDAYNVIERLKQDGMKVVLISGDSLATTRSVAQQIGVDQFYAETLPEQKLELLSSFQQQGNILAMVGDGINDAPALAQADLGIALGSGTDIAIQAASMVLMNNSLKEIIIAFKLAKKTWKIIRQNLFWAFLYNSFAISLAIIGMLNPLIAAGAMLISSISVIINSLRLTSAIDEQMIYKQKIDSKEIQHKQMATAS